MLLGVLSAASPRCGDFCAAVPVSFCQPGSAPGMALEGHSHLMRAWL